MFKGDKTMQKGGFEVHARNFNRNWILLDPFGPISIQEQTSMALWEPIFHVPSSFVNVQTLAGAHDESPSRRAELSAAVDWCQAVDSPW